MQVKLQMSSFEIRGEDGFIRISIKDVLGFPERTTYSGGYETESTIELKCQTITANGTLWISTGEIYTLFKSLEKCQKSLSENLEFETDEHDLKLQILYEIGGKTRILGEYRPRPDLLTILNFEIPGDQSYLNQTLTELKKIVNKYGDNQGINKTST